MIAHIVHLAAIGALLKLQENQKWQLKKRGQFLNINTNVQHASMLGLKKVHGKGE